MFDMALSVKAFVILLLGGAGTVFGPVIGAFAVEGLANLTWSHLLDWHLGVMGLLIIAIVLAFPDGFGAAIRPGGWLGARLSLWTRRRDRRNREDGERR